MDPDLAKNYRLQKIDSMSKAVVLLLPGDHIAWERETETGTGTPGFHYSHHAIVSKKYLLIRKLVIIEYTKQGKNLKATIHETTLDLNDHNGMDYGHLYKIMYPINVRFRNPPHVVLKRAMDRLGESMYDLLKNNCEALAIYCKTGVEPYYSPQVQYRLQQAGTGFVIGGGVAAFAVALGFLGKAIADDKEKKKNQQYLNNC